MKRLPDFSKYSFLLVAHYATFAYQDLLFEYLTKRKAKLVKKVNFPLPELPSLKQLEITTTEYGGKTNFKKYRSLSKPPFVAYIFQSFQFLWIFLFSSQKYDYVIAEDSLLAFLCILLKKFGKCKTIIFYSHGLDKKRFNNYVMNMLYRKLDYVSATQSDYNWFLNRTYTEFRRKQGVSYKKLFWIPASIEVKTVKRKNKVFNHKIVFLGVVNRKNGAHLIPKIIHEVKKTIPDIQLDIIGNGNLFIWTKKEIMRLNLEENIKLLGMLEFKDFASILTNYSVGIAPYEDVFDTLTATSDSLKMRVYLAAGLPVVITKGFVFSDEIEENRLGFAVACKKESFANAIIELLQNKTLNQAIRKKAFAYSHAHDIINIYNKTFQKIINA